MTQTRKPAQPPAKLPSGGGSYTSDGKSKLEQEPGPTPETDTTTDAQEA